MNATGGESRIQLADFYMRTNIKDAKKSCSNSTCFEKSKAQKKICLPVVDISKSLIQIGNIELGRSHVILIILGSVVLLSCLGKFEKIKCYFFQ